MKLLPQDLINKLNRQYGVMPIPVLKINWGDAVYYYAEKEFQLSPGVYTHGIVKEFGNINFQLRPDGFGEQNTITVSLFDAQGHLKYMFDTHNFFSRQIKCTVYLTCLNKSVATGNVVQPNMPTSVTVSYGHGDTWNTTNNWGGIDPDELQEFGMIELFKGILTDPLIWDEGTRSVSISMVTDDIILPVGFNPDPTDVDISDPNYNYLLYNLNTGPWPHIFGTVYNYPMLKLCNNSQATLIVDYPAGVGNPPSWVGISPIHRDTPGPYVLKFKDWEQYPQGVKTKFYLQGTNSEGKPFSIIILGTFSGGDGTFTIDGPDDFNLTIATNLSLSHQTLSTWLPGGTLSSTIVNWMTFEFEGEYFFRNSYLKISQEDTNFPPHFFAYCHHQEGNKIWVMAPQIPCVNPKIVEAQAMGEGMFKDSPLGYTWYLRRDWGVTLELFDDRIQRTYIIDLRAGTSVDKIIDPTTRRVLPPTEYEVISTDGTDSNKLWIPAGTVHPQCTYVVLRKDAADAINRKEEVFNKLEPITDFLADVTSPITTHTDAIKYLIELYSSEITMTTDAPEYPKVNNFAFLAGGTLSDVVSRIAWQNGAILRTVNNIAKVIDVIHEKQEVYTFNEDNVQNKSLQIGYSDTSKLITRFKVVHQVNDLLVKPYTKRYNSNIDLYAERPYNIEYQVTNTPNDIIPFWIKRMSHVWKTVILTSYLDTVFLDVWDTVLLDFTRVTGALQDETPYVNDFTPSETAMLPKTKGLIQNINLDFQQGTIQYTILVPIVAGTNVVDPSFWGY